MAGIALASELTSRDARGAGGVRFALATAAHDPALRRLLRESPMPGRIALSLEREPSYFAAAALEGPEHHTIIALEDGRVVAAGSVSARGRFINGRAMRVGYLGALRLAPASRGRASILLRGYNFFRQLHERGGPPLYLTSIFADNRPARRFLERGLSGMPNYRFLGEFVTLAIPRARAANLSGRAARAFRRLRQAGLQVIPGSTERRAEIRDLLNRELGKYQFAPEWAESEIYAKNFCLVCAQDGTLVGCAAIWDQRAFKQSVVRGYRGSLRWARKLINAGATALGRPALPPLGAPISHAFISHLAAPSGQPEIAEALLRSLQGAARALGVDYLTLGFDARDARLAHLRKMFHAHEYVSRIYAVHWPDGAALAESLEDRLLAPEVAIL